MRRDRMAHEFVEYVPSTLAEGVLYVSVRFRTVVHLCACGCTTKIATPLSPANWQLSFDGKSISLTPSIGAWGLPCRSHYWIEAGTVRWSSPWTEERIRRGRVRDYQARRHYFAQRAGEPADEAPAPPAAAAPTGRRRFTSWLPKRRRRGG
jgi:hypothetical protein